MILVDTSVWVRHLRDGEATLKALLEEGKVACHPFIVGELACGNLRNRAEILALLQALPTAKVASHEEVLQFVERRQLMGKGIGYVDAHLLVSAALTEIPLWTFDRQLRKVSSGLGLGFHATRP